MFAVPTAGVAGAFDACEASVDALDQCAMENFFFNIRREGRQRATPLEFQLQWRVSKRSGYLGSAALAAHREAGPSERIVTLVADGPLTTGATVSHEGAAIGTVVNAGRSPALDRWVGLALLATPYAHPGIDEFVASHADETVPLRTVSPPVLNNRSIFVSPQMHSYRTRAEFDFPPLAKEWP